MAAVKKYSVSLFKKDVSSLSEKFRLKYKESCDDDDLSASLMLHTLADMLDVVIQNFGLDDKGVL